MVLCDADLERFLITKTDVENERTKGNFYPMLNLKRNEYFKTQYAESKKYVEYAAKEHELSSKLIKALKDKNVPEVKKMLCERNKGAEETKRSRTVVVMDATGSMAHLLQKAKNAVSTMFERITVILKENGKPANSFEMMFAVYRNYSAPESLLLQSSPWESNPENLRKFMETVSANYGCWPGEAVEIGLAHANRERDKGDVSQVILIGDMPANTETQVISHRNAYNGGESYWKKTQLFANPTNYKQEMKRLAERNIPVHAFYVANSARTNFEEIAGATKGQCEFLDINSTRGSDQLTDLVCVEVLKNAGGSDGKAFVEAYKKQFVKSYT